MTLKTIIKSILVSTAVLLSVVFVFGLVWRSSRICSASDEQRDFARKQIGDFGYDCRVVDSMCFYHLREGMTVVCNNSDQTFELEKHGSKWSVKMDVE